MPTATTDPEVINNPVAVPLPPAFDFRAVPVTGIDTHLPAVPIDRFGTAALRHRFASPPVWAPEFRREPRISERTPAQAAVLIPIVMRKVPTVLLTERTTHLSTHSGQIAFPGGRVDPDDANVTAAALREAWEEVGLSAMFIEVLGSLPTYTTVTSFIVTPVVALVQPGFELQTNPYEVADAFEVPLPFLMDPSNHRRHRMSTDGHTREWISMPYQDGPTERFVWGATAGMLRNLYRFLIA